MSIFIALIFQVLFVFFAMVINVGLLVHHKINLQNSVDIGAYYAASRQAELLNTIAHQNYQIRQAWKLLSWRYRVLGTLGFENHPSKANDDSEGFWLKSFNNTFLEKQGGVPPVVCTAFAGIWKNAPDNEDSCEKYFSSGGYNVPALRVPNIIAGFLSIAGSVRSFAQRANEDSRRRCEYIGVSNWQTAARMLYDYKVDQANRKETIKALAIKMSESPSDFRDLDGSSVALGVEKTIRKNLTDPNRDSLGGLQILNSMALGPCQNRGWLSEIQTAAILLYADWKCDGGTSLRSLPPKQVSEAPYHYVKDVNIKNLVDPSGVLLSSMGEFPATDSMRSSLGFEKNPWCMSYVGVKAQTAPKIPFSPLGDITLEARAFAKPFGGRIGPWYTSLWPRGSMRSSGGKPIDPLWPPRADAGGAVTLTPGNNARTLPNYSRFPGDKYGVSSKAVLYEYGRQIWGRLKFWYEMMGPAMMDVNGSSFGGDVLSSKRWSSANSTEEETAEVLRRLEIAAISPDIFDITYYSVEANYWGNYFNRFRNLITASDGGILQIPRGDLGSHSVESPSFNVASQIKTLNNLPLDKAKLFYKVTNKGNLLTSWSQPNPKDYLLDGGIFGQCLSPDPTQDFPADKPPSPGDCVGGGRTGYSVKLVSKDYLLDSHALGGDGATGALLNPPPSDW